MLQELLKKYSFQPHIEYDELYDDFYNFLKLYYMRPDAFDDEWRSKQRWKEE